jgi:hypothetical protein
VRRANGLEPIESVLENFERADRLLMLTSRAFDYESFSPPPNVRVVGPRLDDPAWAGDWTQPSAFEQHVDDLHHVAGLGAVAAIHDFLMEPSEIEFQRIVKSRPWRGRP